MKMELFLLLILLMIVNQLVGTCRGAIFEKFDKKRFWNGVKRIVIIAAGYFTISIAVFITGELFTEIDYLNGLLLEPICRYFVKLVDNLKLLINGTQDLPKVGAK